MVEIREPIIDSNTIVGVAFTEKGSVQFSIWVVYGLMDHAAFFLHFEDSPGAIEVYDFFNDLFKPVSYEMTGVSKSHSRKRRPLTAIWKVKKEKFDVLLKEVKVKLGDEWVEIFSLINDCIGKEWSEDLESKLKRIKTRQTKLSLSSRKD